MHGSISKIPSKNLVRQRFAEGFNSGVRGLIETAVVVGFLNVWVVWRPARIEA
jgi:hypothetical protein